MQRVIDRNAAAADQQIFRRGRHDAAVGNLIIFPAGERADAGSGSARIVNVDRIIDPGDGVVEFRGFVESVNGQRGDTGDPARFPHADDCGDRVEFGAFESGDRGAQKRQKFAHLTTPDDFGVAERFGIGAAVLNDPRGVEVNDVVVEIVGGGAVILLPGQLRNNPGNRQWKSGGTFAGWQSGRKGRGDGLFQGWRQPGGSPGE